MEIFNKLLYIYDFIRPILDIAVLTFILYKAYDFITKSNSLQLLKSAIIIFLAYGVAELLKLNTILWILRILAPGLVIAFAVIFQPEIRKIFLKIGQSRWFAFGSRSKHTYVDAVLTAAEMLSKERRGMLAVFLRHTKLENYMQSGTKLNADLSSSLLVTIFGKDTPLHDGLLAAGCFLPLSEDYNIKKTFGTRHRAALGLSEVSDAVVLVVSEETGAISLAFDSKLNYDLNMSELTKILEKLLELPPEAKNIEDTIDESKPVL